jgi:biotin synthase
MPMIQNSCASLRHRIAQLGQAVLDGQSVTRDQARELARVTGDEVYDLFYWANRIRIQYVGRHVHFCSIVAGKVGNCSEDCGYCSQSAHFQTHVTPSKLTTEQITSAFDQAQANGAESFGVVNSGRRPTERELDWLEPFYRQAAAAGKVRPCATLGELSLAQAHRLRAMGVLRINHNLETSRRNFPNIITTHTYDDRVRTIRNAKAAGLSICAGGIFGMGEDWDDRIDMALDLRELGVDEVPINFLNAIPGTPLFGRQPDLEPMEALQIIAIYRYLLPGQALKICGGRDKILRDLVSWIFFAGASSFMIGNFLTTFGRDPKLDHQMLRDLGIEYETFDEVVHEALPPAAVVAAAPGSALSLPVMA